MKQTVLSGLIGLVLGAAGGFGGGFVYAGANQDGGSKEETPRKDESPNNEDSGEPENGDEEKPGYEKTPDDIFDEERYKEDDA